MAQELLEVKGDPVASMGTLMKYYNQLDKNKKPELKAEVKSKSKQLNQAKKNDFKITQLTKEDENHGDKLCELL